MFTETLTQELSIPGAPAHGATINAGTADCGGVDMSLFERALFVCDVDTLSGGASVVFKLQESSDDSTFTDVTSGAATAITAASKTVTLEIRADQLTAGKRYARVRATEGGGFNAIVSIVPLGGLARHKPGSLSDHAQVSQRLVV